MSVLLEEMNPVFTEPFKKILLAAHHALTNRTIVGIEGRDGIGFKYAISYVARKHYLKVVVCNVEYAKKIYNVLVSLNTSLSNIRLPANVAYKPSNLFNVILATNELIKTDDASLIVFDHCSLLSKSQLRYFISFLRKYNRRTGIMYRMSPNYLSRIRRSWKEEYTNLKKVTDEWGVLENLDDEDLADIVRCNGINDKMLIEDLVKSCDEDLTILARNIERVKKYVIRQKNHQTS